LRREGGVSEIVWSLGQYVLPEVVRSAFGLKAPLPPPVGVYSCQPEPYASVAGPIYRRFGGFLAAVFVQLLVLFLSRNQLVYRGDFQYAPSSGERSFVTDVFEVPGRTSNVVLRTHANEVNHLNNLLALPQATHYVLDGFIWRTGPANPDVRRLVLGLSPGVSETTASPRARTARARESPSRGPSREAACS
jgi:hypothetical protein